MNEWTNKPSTISDYVGFVYLITCKVNKRKYIGQKKFWFKKTLPPLKGYKRKRRSLVESDWKTYFGSCQELKDDVEKFGSDAFRREIIYHCENKQIMNYLETKLQFDKNVLLTDEYYNGIINCKITGRGLNGKCGSTKKERSHSKRLYGGG